MLLSTPIDYRLPEDKNAEMVLRTIQDRERSFERTYTTDLYMMFSDKMEDEISSTNELKHEWIDKAIKRLKRRNFIERIQDEKDRRKVEIRTRSEEIYTHMIMRDPMLFWKLIEKGHFYFIVRFSDSGGNVICPECGCRRPLIAAITGNRAARYVVNDDLHIDVTIRHLAIRFDCGCGYSYSDEVDMFDPLTVEDFSRLRDAADNRRNPV